MNQFEIETRFVRADLVIVAAPGIGHGFRGSEARPLGRAPIAAVALAYARASDTFTSARYLASNRTTSRSTEDRFPAAGSFPRSVRGASSRDWRRVAFDRRVSLNLDRR